MPATAVGTETQWRTKIPALMGFTFPPKWTMNWGGGKKRGYGDLVQSTMNKLWREEDPAFSPSSRMVWPRATWLSSLLWSIEMVNNTVLIGFVGKVKDNILRKIFTGELMTSQVYDDGSNGYYYYCNYYLSKDNSMDSPILHLPLDSNIWCLWLAWDEGRVLEWEVLLLVNLFLFTTV